MDVSAVVVRRPRIHEARAAPDFGLDQWRRCGGGRTTPLRSDAQLCHGQQP